MIRSIAKKGVSSTTRALGFSAWRYQMWLAAFFFCIIACAMRAEAQTVPRAEPGWQFSVTPYAWVPSIDGTLRYQLPGRPGPESADVSADNISVLEALNFAAMVAAEARYQRYSVLTDLIYMNLGAEGSKLRQVNYADSGGTGVAANVDRGTDSSLSGTLWALMGGYTITQGDWGHVDGVAGFRLFSLNAETNIRLSADVAGPSGSTSFSRSARLSDSATLFDGVVGVRGRLVLGRGFYAPYAFDIGAGSSAFTWQASAALGYQNGWAGVALGYRHLSYEQSGNKLVQDLAFSGPFLSVNFPF